MHLNMAYWWTALCIFIFVFKRSVTRWTLVTDIINMAWCVLWWLLNMVCLNTWWRVRSLNTFVYVNDFIWPNKLAELVTLQSCVHGCLVQIMAGPRFALLAVLTSSQANTRNFVQVMLAQTNPFIMTLVYMTPLL